MLQFQTEGRKKTDAPDQGRQEEFFLTCGMVRAFVLFRPSVDWVRPTHIQEPHLLSSVCDPNVNLIQQHPHRHTQNTV